MEIEAMTLTHTETQTVTDSEMRLAFMIDGWAVWLDEKLSLPREDSPMDGAVAWKELCQNGQIFSSIWLCQV